ncbi:hypothetical protein [Nostoc punctiforme]|uniref:hypothetical protein n=1 Tax=Nostoc punctiforme TaxID=272131 RepID=UPI000045C151|nr:hypothetical protein [Nostoc punctiforme]
MAKVIRNGKVVTFNPNKYPRGSHGRFKETPDAPKVTRGVQLTSKYWLSYCQAP